MDGWDAEITRATDAAIREYDKWIKHVRTSLEIQGPLPQNPHIAPPGEYPRINPTQPGVNPGGGAAPPNPYGSMSSVRVGNVEVSVDPAFWRMMATPYSMPVPVSVAQASAGGGSTSIGPFTVIVNGAPTDSPEQFAEQFERELVHVVKRAAQS